MENNLPFAARYCHSFAQLLQARALRLVSFVWLHPLLCVWCNGPPSLRWNRKGKDEVVVVLVVVVMHFSELQHSWRTYIRTSARWHTWERLDSLGRPLPWARTWWWSREKDYHRGAKGARTRWISLLLRKSRTMALGSHSCVCVGWIVFFVPFVRLTVAHSGWQLGCCIFSPHHLLPFSHQAHMRRPMSSTVNAGFRFSFPNRAHHVCV